MDIPKILGSALEYAHTDWEHSCFGSLHVSDICGYPNCSMFVNEAPHYSPYYLPEKTIRKKASSILVPDYGHPHLEVSKKKKYAKTGNQWATMSWY